MPAPPAVTVAPSSDILSVLSVVPLTTNIAFQPTDEDEQDGSYGTLILGNGGRSKYLGPTAGSEWLKDVRSCQ
jgi:hypothetical protein